MYNTILVANTVLNDMCNKDYCPYTLFTTLK